MTPSGERTLQKPPARVGPYVVGALLGAGTYGAVYRARDERSGGEVAIKLLLGAARIDPDVLARFKREARLVSMLRHESTVRLHEAGTTSEGTPFIVFELLSGESLETALARGPMRVEEAVEVARAVLGSLSEAHEAGIVHRDVKPANVFLCSGAGPARVKLLDFGVAKVPAATPSAMTPAGLVLGTPTYMAPEQIAATTVLPAADLYAVGLVLAEMITGRPVFEGSALQICAAKLNAVPPPLAEGFAMSAMGRLVARAIAFEPRERFGSAAEMLAALESAFAAGNAATAAVSGPITRRKRAPAPDGTSPMARSEPRPSRSPRRISVRTAIATGVAIAALFVASGTVAAILQARRGSGGSVHPSGGAATSESAAARSEAPPASALGGERVERATLESPPRGLVPIPPAAQNNGAGVMFLCDGADRFERHEALRARTATIDADWETSRVLDYGQGSDARGLITTVVYPNVNVVCFMLGDQRDETFEAIVHRAAANGYVVLEGHKRAIAADGPPDKLRALRRAICD